MPESRVYEDDGLYDSPYGRGERDARAGEREDACPYVADWARRAWLDGWHTWHEDNDA